MSFESVTNFLPLLRMITGSSSRLLHKHRESLESVLTGQYSPQIVKQRIQSVANLIFQDGESTSRVDSNTIEQGSVSQQSVHLQINSEESEVDNVRHVNIDSDSNVVNNMRRVNIDSRSSMFAKYDVLGNETHGDNSNANVTHRLGHLHFDG